MSSNSLNSDAKQESTLSSDPVKLVEVGPRDGLQNEPGVIPTTVKSSLINALIEARLPEIEVGAYVSPKWVPQMADTSEIVSNLPRITDCLFSALVPNDKGFSQFDSGLLGKAAVFTAVSETFCQKNINCNIDESLRRFLPVIEQAKANKVLVRAYISCFMGCPYEGVINDSALLDLCDRLLDMGCDEISLGDTIGVGRYHQVRSRLNMLVKQFGSEPLAVHFHNTYGQALANISEALELGIRTIDTSIAGLGGCPYAPGASGNVATEDVVYMLEESGMKTGIDLDALLTASQLISNHLDRPARSHVALALSHS